MWEGMDEMATLYGAVLEHGVVVQGKENVLVIMRNGH